MYQVSEATKTMKTNQNYLSDFIKSALKVSFQQLPHCMCEHIGTCVSSIIYM